MKDSSNTHLCLTFLIPSQIMVPSHILKTKACELVFMINILKLLKQRLNLFECFQINNASNINLIIVSSMV